MKGVYIGLGFICLALGLIGIPTPGLPTTPFLLATLYFFGKSSPRLQAWFMQTRIYQKHLRTFNESRAMTLKQKISILAISAPFCLFAIYVLPNIWGKLAMVAVMVCQYWYFFFKIKTLPGTPVSEITD